MKKAYRNQLMEATLCTLTLIRSLQIHKIKIPLKMQVNSLKAVIQSRPIFQVDRNWTTASKPTCKC